MMDDEAIARAKASYERCVSVRKAAKRGGVYARQWDVLPLRLLSGQPSGLIVNVGTLTGNMSAC
jgi:hypothetical protein